MYTTPAKSKTRFLSGKPAREAKVISIRSSSKLLSEDKARESILFNEVDLRIDVDASDVALDHLFTRRIQALEGVNVARTSFCEGAEICPYLDESYERFRSWLRRSAVILCNCSSDCLCKADSSLSGTPRISCKVRINLTSP